ncbi:MAG: TaqI family restriction endonuclease [Thermotogae bacterium]|nr:TaqI family restriction endonuclease [Thermotogota bacterium]
MSRRWDLELKRYEEFIGSLNLAKYAHLRRIKTVEQDLPKPLLPLDLFYRHYWETTDFKDFDEIFRMYWSERLNPHIYEFIRKYFYGCSLQFVEEGFKARLYRIWMSILTQFHFQYLWNASFSEKLTSTAELDAMGIDALLALDGTRVAIQIKKVSYRREASSRRFTQRQRKYADIMVEVPYLVVDEGELEHKLESSRVREETKEKYRRILAAFRKNFRKLPNGFVVFREGYLRKVREIILRRVSESAAGEKIPYREFLDL